MSYDLAVFDPALAPSSYEELATWFGQQTEWSESHGYGDPDVPSASLRAWFHEMIETYPPMNGPLASDDRARGAVTARCRRGRPRGTCA